MIYRREVDGLRALAVLPVILFHAGFTAFSGGYVGVDVFFVISGYLITSLILDDVKAGRFSVLNFYERRARRILPALFLVVAVSTFAAWRWFLPSEMSSFLKSASAVALFSSNIYFFRASGYFDTSAELKPLLHTWSLAVEEQFYVLFPLFVLAGWRWARHSLSSLTMFAGAVSLSLSVYLSALHPDAAFYLLPSRAWELCVGALVAFYGTQAETLQRRWGELLSTAGIGLIVLAIFLFDKNTPFPSWYALVPTVGAALVLAFANARNFTGQLLSTPMLVGTGLVSYSAYLWHQPLFAFARYRDLSEPSSLAYGLLIVMTFLLAALTWRLVELPFRRGKLVGTVGVFLFAGSGTATLLALGFFGYLGAGFPQRFSPEVAALVSSGMNKFEDAVRPCWSKILSDTSAACMLGKSGAPRMIALAGDSHAGTLLGSLDAMLKRAGISGASYTSRSCPPLLDGAPVRLTGGERECIDIRRKFFASLASSDAVPKIVIVHARWAFLMEKTRFNNLEGGIEPGANWEWRAADGTISTPEAMARNFRASVEALLRTGRQVVLVYPVPEAGWDVPLKLAHALHANGRLRPEDGSTRYDVFLKRSERATQALDGIGQHPNLIRVRPEEALCNAQVPNRCIVHLDGTPLYYDNNHLSHQGAELIVHLIARALPPFISGSETPKP